MTSPTATFCCWPPLRTIAYTTDLLPHLVKTQGRVIDARIQGTKTYRRISLRSVTLARQNGGVRGDRIRRVGASFGSPGKCFWVINTHLLGLRLRLRNLGRGFNSALGVVFDTVINAHCRDLVIGLLLGLIVRLLLASLAPAGIVVARIVI